MKTLVICILFSTAFAKPATLEEHSHRFETIEDVPDIDFDTNIREKKAPALTQIRYNNHGESFQLSDDDLHGIIPTEERTISGVKKPIIIKKRVGYRLYRDSDEEQAQANSKEKCQKQVKVKLCEDETETTSQRRDQGTALDTKHDHMTEKEIKHSIEMAKEAVEHLQRDLKVIRSSSTNQDKSLQSSSDSELHDDIEKARQVLEHIHSNFGNLQSMRVHATTLNNEDLSNIETEKKRMAQWKETFGQENTDSLRNIEDRFKTDNHHDDNVNIEKKLNKVNKMDDQERNSANTGAENMETTINNKERETETSMTQDIQSKTKLHSDNLTMLPSTVTTSLKEDDQRDTLLRSMNENEGNNMGTNEKEKENHDVNMKPVETNLNQFRENKDFGNQMEIETQTSNKVDHVAETKNEKMRHTDLKEDPNETSATTDQKIQSHNKDRSIDGLTAHEDMLQKHFNEPLKTNTANVNIAVGLNHLKSAETSEQNKVTPMSLNEQSNSKKTHESTQHQLLGLLNTARTHDEVTGMVIPTTTIQDITHGTSRDSITNNMQRTEFDTPTFHNTHDQLNAASENMRWMKDNNIATFQQMRNEDFSNHGLMAKIPSNEHFNMHSMRNSHSGGAMDKEHHTHHLMNDRFAHEFDKEPSLRGEVMRSNSNAHAHHDFSHHPQHMTSEVAPVHGMVHKTSHADSAVQASNHMDTMQRSAAEYAQQWFTSRGMYRESQPNLTPPSYSPGAVGYFPNAKAGGCAIPLLLSCSPSVVSGTLAKSHSYSAPSTYDYRYHNKRETKNLVGKLAPKPDSTTMLSTKIKSTTNDVQ